MGPILATFPYQPEPMEAVAHGHDYHDRWDGDLCRIGCREPIVFSHGWPLTADDWDPQMLFFLLKAIASSRTTAAATVAQAKSATGTTWTTTPLTLRQLPRISISGRDPRRPFDRRRRGRALRRPARRGRVEKPVLISAVPPLMVKTPANPGGCRRRVRRSSGGKSRPTARSSTATSPRPVLQLQPAGREPVRGIIENWWRQGMMGGAKAHHDGIVAFSQTDFTEDLKQITVPTLVMHGDDDQIVPSPTPDLYPPSWCRTERSKTYKGFPHGMPDDRRRHHQRRPAPVAEVIAACRGAWKTPSRSSPPPAAASAADTARALAAEGATVALVAAGATASSRSPRQSATTTAALSIGPRGRRPAAARCRRRSRRAALSAFRERPDLTASQLATPSYFPRINTEADADR